MVNPWLSILVFIHITNVSSQSIIRSLPGYVGTLPFKLETGYISVGDENEVQLFYYFVESENDPVRDPLVLWLTGGPSCSGFSSLVYDIGPLVLDYKRFDGGFPSFSLNPYSWTKVASIIFIDSPAGSGFSYATTPDGYATLSDSIASNHNHMFLRKWLSSHPSFIENRLYIAGDSYGGKMTPMLALEIAEANIAGLEPRLSLMGYIIGNPVVDEEKDHNVKLPYAHRMALISDEYFELAKNSCNGEYSNPDPNNQQCLAAIKLFEQCTNHIYTDHILEPKCWDNLLSEEDNPVDLLLLSKQDEPFCLGYNYMLSYIWANNETVQEVLHVHKGTVAHWKRCDRWLTYDKNIESVFEHHRLLIDKGFHALVYSGDHDFGIPYMGTLKWIRNLNLTLVEAWRPWTVDGQVGGYTVLYQKHEAYLTFATVKGGGHTAATYRPKECFAMVDRWLSFYPL